VFKIYILATADNSNNQAMKTYTPKNSVCFVSRRSGAFVTVNTLLFAVFTVVKMGDCLQNVWSFVAYSSCYGLMMAFTSRS
jgi:hypothetical protein